MEFIRCNRCKVELPKKHNTKWKRFWLNAIPYYADDNLNLHLCKECCEEFKKWLKKPVKE